jgi:uncharacterized membrane protein
MKNIFKNRSFIIQLAVCLIPFIIGAVFYSKMPDQVATHFDFNFQPDDYSSREFALFGIPAVMVGLFILCAGLLEVDPKKRGMDGRLKSITRWVIPILSVFIQCVTISFALNSSVNLTRFIPVLIGILFVLMGNYLPKCRQNYTMGIKLPWTLNSEENWDRTHRFGGRLFVVSGLCMIIAAFFSGYVSGAIFVLALIACFVPTIYSYWLYKKGI